MSAPLFAIDASSNSKVKILATSNKLNVRASEIEDKLETLNTTCSNINVSVGDVTVNTADLETLQTAANASLVSLDTKTVVCDTDQVVISSSALPSGAASSSLQTAGNASLALIDGKITACNTGAVVVSSTALAPLAATSTLQTAGNTSLVSLDTKMVVCDTDQVVVSSSALPSGAASSANQTIANASLSNLETDITTLLSYVDGLEASATDNGTKLDDIVTNTASSGGSPTRTQSSIASGSSVSGGSDVGSAVDCSSFRTLVINGSTTDSGNLEILCSQDGGTTYRFQESIWSNSDDSGNYYYHKVIEHPSKHIKFKNPSSGSTMTITLTAEGQNW